MEALNHPDNENNKADSIVEMTFRIPRNLGSDLKIYIKGPINVINNRPGVGAACSARAWLHA